MLYKKYQSIPANTTAEAPNWQKLKVCKGEIVQWIIFFDPEAANLLHVRVEYHGSSIMPFGGKDWMVAFFTDTPLTDSLMIDVPPYELDILAYNEDDSYNHEYYIHPIIKTEKPVSPVSSGFDFKSAWSNLFGGG